MSFWKKLKKPILALAPMADVTDAAFRRIIAKYGKPDVMFTEFTSVAGLCSRGKEKLLHNFWYHESERPIIAQIFGSKPEQFYEVAQLLQELKFDGIDINMGCPDKSIEKQGGGAALMKNSELTQKIVVETKRGAGKLPVSVKTRLGYSKIDLDWIRAILDAEPAALVVHLRTRKEMSDVPAHWDVVPEIMALVSSGSAGEGCVPVPPLILCNGDVKDIPEAKEKCKQHRCDGVMIGRGIFGNPWLFCGRTVSLEEKLKVMLEHTYLFEELFAGIKNFDIMKKHYKAYVSGFDGAKELRIKLMACKTADEVAATVKNSILT